MTKAICFTKERTTVNPPLKIQLVRHSIYPTISSDCKPPFSTYTARMPRQDMLQVSAIVPPSSVSVLARPTVIGKEKWNMAPSVHSSTELKPFTANSGFEGPIPLRFVDRMIDTSESDGSIERSSCLSSQPYSTTASRGLKGPLGTNLWLWKKEELSRTERNKFCSVRGR
ncbi:hypothetical protein NA56DRAFT_702420 [Hyaloscypha hepaticicola]|uniref:Uncharacterized protein n=1 Tax=Hyaloscypha hepaticicola TaxID=2082293 RepID=A0A2J6Q8S1_9HELO|nr:hypothetical protein NA56DRAFT_702420 [Hyaloscypha hepaticicola]